MFFRKNQTSTSSSTPSKAATPAAAASTAAASPNGGTARPTTPGGGGGGKSQTNFEEKWTVLQAGVNKLVDFLGSGSSKPYDFNEYATLYATVYNLCTQKVDTGKLTAGPTELLYDRYKKCIAQYLQEKVVPTLKAKQGEVLLLDAVKKWRDHKLVVRWMCKVFNYLDRYYTKHNNRDSLNDVGLKCYQQYVYESIKRDMATALLQKVLQERNGERIDRSVMKDGIGLFTDMGLNSLTAYEKDFETALLHETTSFYKRESAKYIAENTCPDYMKKAESRLEEEHARCKAYLHHTTENTLVKRVEAELITAHAQRLLEMENSGFVALLKDHKRDDLARMFRLFHRIRDLKPMADMMRDFIKDEGMGIVNTHQDKDELDCSSYINALLELHQKYSDLVNVEFQKDAMFLEALKDAFTHFVNTDLVNRKTANKSSSAAGNTANNGSSSGGGGVKTSTAELLSTYCDTVMKSTEKFGDENMEELLERIVKLFGYISDKDMFQEFYRRQLSKRLLVSSKANYDTERSLIAKLKMRCGASFTSKLEGMIKDKSLSEDLQNAFQEYLKSKDKELVLDFAPKVLTTGFWPAFKIDQLTVPEEFTQCVACFKEFYDSRTESRSLKWVHSLGTCQLLGRYSSGSYDLQMSAYQACILMLFNEQEEWIAEDVSKALSMPPDDVKRNLLSLTVNKNCKVLNKTGNPKSMAPEDVFTVNMDFESKTRRIKVPNLVLVISDTERKDIDKTTQEDRKHAIEAAIVRIMKSRKKLDHQTLILETSKQLLQHFKPDPKFIKRRIEDLITREYLSRDESTPNVYNYVA